MMYVRMEVCCRFQPKRTDWQRFRPASFTLCLYLGQTRRWQITSPPYCQGPRFPLPIPDDHVWEEVDLMLFMLISIGEIGFTRPAELTLMLIRSHTLKFRIQTRPISLTHPTGGETPRSSESAVGDTRITRIFGIVVVTLHIPIMRCSGCTWERRRKRIHRILP